VREAPIVKEKVAMGFEGNILPVDESLGLNMAKDACVSIVLIIVCESMLAYSGKV
jgi:hypothetical protein